MHNKGLVKALGERVMAESTMPEVADAAATRMGRYRWVIERTLAWFARFRRLTVRYERRLDILLGFHLLAAALVCLRFVERWFCPAREEGAGLSSARTPRSPSCEPRDRRHYGTSAGASSSRAAIATAPSTASAPARNTAPRPATPAIRPSAGMARPSARSRQAV